MTAVRAIPADNHLLHQSPNWVDLYAVDATAARAFYASLFGWRFQNRFSLNPVAGSDTTQPIEEARATHLVLCCGRPSAEIIERNELFADMVLPSRWYPHIHVVDMSATLRRVQAAGGSVIRSPQCRGSLATVATVIDPVGAMLCLWQPMDLAGNPLSYTSGSLSWIELRTPDLDQTRWFYQRVFEWRPTAEPPTISKATEPNSHLAFWNELGPVAGAVLSGQDGIASWYPSFAVNDLAAATDTARRLGALAVGAPYDLPIGRQCAVIDPEGAEFSLLGPRWTTRSRRSGGAAGERI